MLSPPYWAAKRQHFRKKAPGKAHREHLRGSRPRGCTSKPSTEDSQNRREDPRDKVTKRTPSSHVYAILGTWLVPKLWQSYLEEPLWFLKFFFKKLRRLTDDTNNAEQDGTNRCENRRLARVDDILSCITHILRQIPLRYHDTLMVNISRNRSAIRRALFLKLACRRHFEGWGWGRWTKIEHGTIRRVFGGFLNRNDVCANLFVYASRLSRVLN